MHSVIFWQPTHGKKNIDALILDMVHFYRESIVIPYVPTDIPDGQAGGGKASGHQTVYCEPRVVAQSNFTKAGHQEDKKDWWWKDA